MASTSFFGEPARDEECLRQATLGVAIMSITLTTTTTVLRMYTRLKIIKKTGWEDWIMCIANTCFLGYCTTGLLGLRFGIISREHLSLEAAIRVLKVTWAIEVMYQPIIALIRLSILLQMRRIFIPMPGTRTRSAMAAFIWLNMIWFVAAFWIAIFQCNPVDKFWDPRVQGHCIKSAIYIIMGAIFNMIVDCIMLALPLFWIWQLQLSTYQKTGVSAIFLVGAFACATSIIRVVYSFQNLYANSSNTTLTVVALSAEAEIVAGFLCGNLPNFPALVRHLRLKRNCSNTCERSSKRSDVPPQNDSLHLPNYGSKPGAVAFNIGLESDLTQSLFQFSDMSNAGVGHEQ